MATHAVSSGTTPRATSTSDQVSGWSVFAGVVLIVVGFFNLLDGIAAIAQSHVYVGNAVYVMCSPATRRRDGPVWSSCRPTCWARCSSFPLTRSGR